MSAFHVLVEGWASLAWTVTWQLATLAWVAAMCEWLLRLSQPRVRHTLWWLVLLAPLLLAPARLALSARTATVAVPAPAFVATLATPPAASASAIASRPEARPPSHLSTPVALFTLWAMGCALSLSHLLSAHRRMRRMLARSEPVPSAEMTDLLSALCARSGVRPVWLRSSPEVASPVLCGSAQPTVVVPRTWLQEVAPSEVEALLTHEAAHVARHDVLANLLQRLICVPLFFHPAAWLASRQISAAREQLCDAWALARGTERECYARALAAAAERAHARYAAVSVGIAENKLGLLQRVEAIMDGGNRGHISRRLILALAIVLLGSCAALAVVQFRATHARSAEAGRIAIGELDLNDLSTALSVAGVQAYRLNYQAPFDHMLNLTTAEYVSGQRVDPDSMRETGVSGYAGEQSLLVMVKKEGDKISFWFYNKGGGGGGHAFSFAGYDSFTNGPLQTRLTEGKAIPIYFYAANRPERGGIMGVGSDASLDRITHSYDTAIVVFAELERPKPQPETAPLPSELGPEGGPVVDLSILLANGQPAAGAQVKPVGDERTAPSTLRIGANGHLRFAIEREPRLYEDRPREATLIVTSADGKQHATVAVDMTPGKRIARTVRLQPQR